jgi:hypothetical protein
VVQFYSRKRIDHIEGYVAEDAKDPGEWDVCRGFPLTGRVEETRMPTCKSFGSACMHVVGSI